EVNGLWYIAKAVNLARIQGNPQAGESMETYGKEKYRKYHGGEDGWDQIVSQSANQTVPPADFPPKIPATKTPCELAVLAVEQGECCSIDDVEFILKQRDCSPANKTAADKIWYRVIQDRQ